LAVTLRLGPGRTAPSAGATFISILERTEAAQLTDQVFPRQSERWWLLAVPKPPRYFMLREWSLVNMVRRIFLRVIA
jgi:hypothetical protein